MTDRLPIRRAVRAQSIAVFPAPTTITSRPTITGVAYLGNSSARMRFTRVRNSFAV